MTLRVSSRELIAQLIVALLLIGGWPNSSSAQLLNWDGTCGTLWHEVCSGSMTNWKPDSVPGPSNVCMATGATIIVNQPGQNATSLITSGGSFEITPAGVLTLSGGGSIDNALIRGAFISHGNTNLTAASSMTNGGLRGAGPFKAQGTFTISGGAVGEFNSPFATELQNDGQMNITGGFGINTKLKNLSSGSVNINNSVSIGGVTSGVFENAGTVTVTAPGVGFLSSYRQTGGMTAVNGGELQFVSGNAELSGGTMQVSNNGTIRLRDTVAPTGGHVLDGLTTVSGDGHFVFGSGNFFAIHIDQPVTFDLNPTDTSVYEGMDLASGTIVFDADVTNQGKARLQAEITGVGSFINDGSLRIRGGTLKAPLINNSAVLQYREVGSADVQIGTGGRIDNMGGATWNQLNGSILQAGGNGRFTNQLSDVVAAGSGLLSVNVPFDQDAGRLIVDDGGVRMYGSGAWTGRSSAEIVAGSDLRYYAGTQTFSGKGHKFFGRGIVSVGGSFDPATFMLAVGSELELDVGNDATSHLVSGFWLDLNGQIVGNGHVTNNGFFDWLAGRIGTAGGETQFTNSGSLWILLSHQKFLRGTLINQGSGTADEGVVCQSSTPVIEAGSALLNQGLWSVESGADLNGPSSVTFTNSGIFRAEPTVAGTETSVITTFDNTGTVHALTNATIRFYGPVVQLPGNVLLAGTWRTFDGGRIVFPSNIKRIGPGATVVGNSNSVPALTGLETIAGMAGVDGQLQVTLPLKVEDGGRAMVGSGSTIESPSIQVGRPAGDPVGPSRDDRLSTDDLYSGENFGPPACTTVPHVITTTLDVHGIIDPAPDGAIGLAIIQGDLVLYETAELQLDIAGDIPCIGHDQVVIDGAANLDGTIRVTLQDGFEPPNGASFPILTATGGVFGEFDRVISPTFGSGRTFKAVPGRTLVALVVKCAADITNDDVIDVSDLIAVVTSWGACGDCNACPADIAPSIHDCVVNVTDLLAVITSWGACP